MISVITPVFNGAAFIEACIQNVISQQCDGVEHIIVDGGSRDGTAEILQEYAHRYPHIRWLSEKDGGQSDAMNKGIGLAKGPVICFLNVDDYFEPDALNRAERLIGQIPEPGMLVGNCNVWDEKNCLMYVNRPDRLTLSDLLVGTEIFMFPANPSAYFYHKSLHDVAGLYDADDHYSMDLDFLLRAVRVANVRYVNEDFGNFRLIPGTKTYEDIRVNGGSRARTVIRKYEEQLPVNARFLLRLKRAYYYTGYYLRHIAGRIRRIFRG